MQRPLLATRATLAVEAVAESQVSASFLREPIAKLQMDLENLMLTFHTKTFSSRLG